MKRQPKTGITNLLAAMLNESTKNYTTEAMSMALEKLGSQIISVVVNSI